MLLYGIYLLYGIFAVARRLQRGVQSYPTFIGACSVILTMNILGILLQFLILTLAFAQIPITTTLLRIMAYLFDISIIVILGLISQRMMVKRVGELPRH